VKPVRVPAEIADAAIVPVVILPPLIVVLLLLISVAALPLEMNNVPAVSSVIYVLDASVCVRYNP